MPAQTEGSERAGLHVGEQSHQSRAFCCAASILGRTLIQLFSFPPLSSGAGIQKETKTEEWDYNFVALQGHLLCSIPCFFPPRYCFTLLLFQVGALALCRLHPWKADLGELCVVWVKYGKQQTLQRDEKLCLCTLSLRKVYMKKVALGSQEFYQILEKLFHAQELVTETTAAWQLLGSVCDQSKPVL